LGTIGTPAPSRGIRRPGGQWLVQPDQSQDEDEPDGAMVVHREDLHDTLVAGLGDRIDIRTGVAVRTVHAAAGDLPAVGDGRTTWTADLVVAADGVDSVVRRRLAPESTAVAAGCAAWRAVIPWYRAPKPPTDAATLRALLIEAAPGKSLVHALEEYSVQRRPRVARIIRQSRRVGAVYAANGNLVIRARNAALGLTPRLLGRAGAVARQWRPPA